MTLIKMTQHYGIQENGIKKNNIHLTLSLISLVKMKCSRTLCWQSNCKYVHPDDCHFAQCRGALEAWSKSVISGKAARHARDEKVYHCFCDRVPVGQQVPEHVLEPVPLRVGQAFDHLRRRDGSRRARPVVVAFPAITIALLITETAKTDP